MGRLGIPREADAKWTDAVKQLHNEWWLACGGIGSKRSMRQSLKHADTELLYDQPYEDNKKIRVTGPFTVESLSPHRVLSTDDDELPATEVEGKKESGGEVRDDDPR